jgi:hypothetical protein
MADALHLLALSLAHDFGSVAGELIPKSGTGPISCSVVVRSQRDEVVQFPELRGLLGAERPGWMLNFTQADVMVRPVAGDRVTVGDTIYQLRGVQSDVLGIRWLTTAFIVEAAAVGDIPVMMPPYLCGAGVLTL